MTDIASAHDSLENKAAELLRLHRDPTLLTVVNVWDSISAQVVADTPGTTALATASHSIAASWGYADGENIPVDLMIQAVGRIVQATTLPVSADLEGGYGDPAGTIRKAIGVGIVGANLEDQLRPTAEAAANVEAIMDAGSRSGGIVLMKSVDRRAGTPTDFSRAGSRSSVSRGSPTARCRSGWP